MEEVLGPRWGNLELQMVDLNPKEWKAVFALGELYERMENFGVAYRKFRSIFNSHFSKSNLTEMIPIFKKLYPFYFTEHIDYKNKIDSACILFNYRGLFEYPYAYAMKKRLDVPINLTKAGYSCDCYGGKEYNKELHDRF